MDNNFPYEFIAFGAMDVGEKIGALDVLRSILMITLSTFNVEI